MRPRCRDLVVLVADNGMKAAVRGLLSRPEALGIRAVDVELYVHPERDPGCLNRGDDFLRPMADQYSHALLMFDRQGCGQERRTREEIEQRVAVCLSRAGWAERADAVVFDPELEAWVWSDSPAVDHCLGWQGLQPSLRNWLEGEGLWPGGMAKPLDPKTAVERALRQVRKPRSAAIFGQLAQQVSFRRCRDGSFVKFTGVLRNWFATQPIIGE